MRTILPWVADGGPFVVPVLLVGVIGLFLLAERIWYIGSRSRVHAGPFMEEVVSLARSGDTEAALRLCADHQAALADLGLVILRTATGDRDTLHDIAAAAAASILPQKRRSVRVLTTFTLLVLMLGALGAIANLHTIAGAGSPGGVVALAYVFRPVGAALLISLPLVAGTAYVAAVSAQLAALLNDFGSRLVAALTDGPDVRLGHRA